MLAEAGVKGQTNVVRAACIAGFFAAACSLPFDFIKTRIQVGSNTARHWPASRLTPLAAALSGGSLPCPMAEQHSGQIVAGTLEAVALGGPSMSPAIIICESVPCDDAAVCCTLVPWRAETGLCRGHLQRARLNFQCLLL